MRERVSVILRNALEQVRRLDAWVAQSTAPGTAFDGRVQQGETWLHDQAGSARLPDAAGNATSQGVQALRRGAAFCGQERTGLAGLVVVVVLAYPLTRLLWTPLSWPASIFNRLTVWMTPNSCDMFGPSNLLSDQVCGTVLAVLTVFGAVVAMLGLLLVRLPLRRILRVAFGGVPEEFAFLGPPLLAAVLFTVGWAGIQYHFPDRPGIVTDGAFPTVFAALVYALARYGPWVQEAWREPFAWRDRFSPGWRLGLVILVPLAYSTVTTPLLRTPVRDQTTVVVGLIAGYLLLAPLVAAVQTKDGGE